MLNTREFRERKHRNQRQEGEERDDLRTCEVTVVVRCQAVQLHVQLM